MRSVKIPHTELPGASALFADYLYHYDRVARFYSHDPHDSEGLKRAALAASRLDNGRRQSLVAALRRVNGESAALAQLELPETVAVVTGQQVGLFSGPAYTIYKALTAVRIAHRLSESGIRAVPVFWLATEDHDLAEADHAWVYNPHYQPLKLTAQSAPSNSSPVGRVEITKPPIDELAAALRGFLYADEVVGLAEECYQPGRSFGEAFRLILQRLLSGYGIVFLDPLDPAFRALAAPFLEQAHSQHAALIDTLLARGAELTKAGYHNQVLVEKDSSLFFKLENGQRTRLKPGESVPDSASLSPNALLRPVMQDFVLPTAAYVGGPAELAYLAQSKVLYDALLGRMPVAAPRSGFTLLDERALKLMERFHISLTDTFHGEDTLRQRISARLVPETLQIAFEDTASEVRNSLDRLEGQLRDFDPTLAAALKKSRAKIAWQIEKNHNKAARESLRRDSQVAESARHLSSLVFPERHLQERLYSILPFLARHGFDIIDTIHDAIPQSGADHTLLTL